MDQDAADQPATTGEPTAGEAWYTAPPVEDGSAPVAEIVEVLTRTVVYRDLKCGRCLVDLESADLQPDLPDGQWRYLLARDALCVTLSGGYGAYVDPMRGDHASLLLCSPCTDWLRAEVPGVEMVIKRLNHH